jgi:hypothetical protein
MKLCNSVANLIEPEKNTTISKVIYRENISKFESILPLKTMQNAAVVMAIKAQIMSNRKAIHLFMVL